MRLCWTLRSIPELGVLSDAERRAALAAAGGWRMPLRFATVSLIFAAGIGFVAHVVLNVLGTPSRVQSIGAVVGFIAGIPVTYQFLMVRARVQIRLAIMEGFKGERVPVCLRCGHDTRGAEGERCPECNAPLRA